MWMAVRLSDLTLLLVLLISKNEARASPMLLCAASTAQTPSGSNPE